jgi:PAS domain S-box-containing protein
MLSTLMVPGYDIIEVIHEGFNTTVYLAQSELHRQPVILKVLSSEYPTLEQITRLKHEYKVTENLDLEGIIKFYRLETHQNGLMLVAEFGGISLKQFLSTSEEYNLSTFLSIAVQLAKSLVSLHTHHIIHKDIKPANIIINPSTFEVKLTDFSIAERLNKESLQLSSPNQLEGTLAYMSPEQTGRMNCTLDYRSDFYSFGVTLYEILTRQLPFQSNDPLEIVHCHMAKEPVAIQKLNPLVPGVIVAIVTKMMAKNAEDRYQSAFGLLADLEYCLDQFKNTGQIPDFTPGRLDILNQLLIPELKLPGCIGDKFTKEESAVVLCYERYWMGEDLAEVEKIISSLINAIAPFNQNTLRIFHQATLNLLGRSEDVTILSGESYDIAESIPAQEISSDRTGLFFSYVCQQQLHYLFGQYALSLEKGTAANCYASGVVGLLPSVIFNFYDSLTKLAIYTNAVPSKCKQILKQVATNQKKLKRWADSALMNHQHKYDLVEAEKCRVLDKLVQAGNLYDRAIQGATENGYTQEVALFNELAAKFYLAQGKNKIAKVYFTDAYYNYIRWGAIAKVRHLEESYPGLIIRNQMRPAIDDITETLLENITHAQSTSINSEQLLDLATVMKATSAISGEIVLDNLLKNLLHIILENASAQKGCIILERNNQLFIEVADISQTESIIVLESTPVETSQDIPVSLIKYVATTHKAQVFNNASQETLVKSDPYIREYQPKSVLCAPILYQSKLRGIVYLENNLATGAFTRTRLQLIQILTAQAAIAIENARLYSGEQEKSKQLAESLQQLAQKEEQYRGIFETAIDGLGICDIETGKFVAVNPAICQMYRFPAEEWENLQPPDLIHPDYLHVFGEFVESIKAGKEFYCQAVVIRKDGTLFDVDVKASPYIYKGKLHALMIHQDISKQQAALRDRQQALSALQQRSQDLEQALQKLQRTQGQLVQTEKISQLGQLVAGVAHEVNNPVSFISGNLSHTKQNVEDLINLLHLYQKYLPNPPIEITEEIENIDLEYLLEDLPKMISSMKLGTDRIRDIMQSLRNFSRSDANEKKAVDIHQSIDTTLIVLSHRLKASPSRPAIQIVKEYGEIPAFECYSGQINQVFMNLLANAIDALEESNAGKTFAQLQQNPNIIRIRTEIVNSTHELKICIADNGCGMSEEVRQNLFNAFFTTKSEGKGTGLGLSISHQIITEAHGGTLECFSNVGEGTEFVILMKEEGRRKKEEGMEKEGMEEEGMEEEGRKKGR